MKETTEETTIDIQEIPIDQIHDHPKEPRKFIDQEALEELKRSIEDVDLIHPITVTPRKNGGYYRIAGNRRLLAYKALGKKGIPANVRLDLDEEKIEAILISENLQRDDLSPMEEAAIFERLLQSKDINDVAAYVNRSIDYIRRRLKLLRLEASLQETLLTGKMTLALAELFSCLPLDKQASMFPMVQEKGLNAVEFSNYLMKQNDRQLRYAAFDTGPCRSCVHNSAGQADLFSQMSSGLGNCLNVSCWTKKEGEKASTLIQTIERMGPRGVLTDKLSVSLSDLPVDVDQTQSVIHQKAELGEANVANCKSCASLVVFVSSRGELLKQNVCTQKKCYQELTAAYRKKDQGSGNRPKQEGTRPGKGKNQASTPSVPETMTPLNAPARVKTYKRNTYNDFLVSAFTKKKENILRLALIAMRHGDLIRGREDGAILKDLKNQSGISTSIPQHPASLKFLIATRDLNEESLVQVLRQMATPVIESLPLETIEQMVFFDLEKKPEDLFQVKPSFLKTLTKAEIIAIGYEGGIDEHFKMKNKTIESYSNKAKSDFIKAMTESGYAYPKLPQWLLPETFKR